MTALSAPYEAARKEGDYVLYSVGASTKIYKGSLLATRADGCVYPVRAPESGQPDVFVGVADETVDNSAGAAAAMGVKTWKKGSFVVAMPGASITNIGSLVYGVDDATVSTTSANAVAIGYVTEFLNASQVRVKIDRAVQ